MFSFDLIEVSFYTYEDIGYIERIISEELPKVHRCSTRSNMLSLGGYYRNREEINNKRRNEYSNNKDLIRDLRRKYYLENSEYILKRTTEYNKNNHAAVSAIKARRRARKKKAFPVWAKNEQNEIKLLYKKAKEIRELGIDVHVDHIIPLMGKTVCGLHCFDNLQIITAEENMRKSNKLLTDEQ